MGIVFLSLFHSLIFSLFSFTTQQLTVSPCIARVACLLGCFPPANDGYRCALGPVAALLFEVFRHEDIARCNKGNSAIFIPNVIVVQDKSGKVRLGGFVLVCLLLVCSCACGFVVLCFC